MIKIAVVGDIGSGKSHVAKQFGYPVFNADREEKELRRWEEGIGWPSSKEVTE